MRAIVFFLAVGYESKQSYVAAQALAECGWIDNDGVDVLMKWELGSANDILPESEMSLKWMLPDDTYSLYGPDDHFVIRLFSCVGVLPSLCLFSCSS